MRKTHGKVSVKTEKSHSDENNMFAVIDKNKTHSVKKEEVASQSGSKSSDSMVLESVDAYAEPNNEEKPADLNEIPIDRKLGMPDLYDL